MFLDYTLLKLCGSVGEEPACNAGDAGDMGLIPGWGRSPGGGHSNLIPWAEELVGYSPWGCMVSL